MNAKILVVEDEIIIADHICSILKKLGHTVLEPCLTYSEAVKTIGREMPTIVFIDIQLAGQKDGVDLAKWIKLNTTCAFIFLTSNLDKQTVQRAKEENPAAFLVKPFTKDEIEKNIENILQRQKIPSPTFTEIFLKEGKRNIKVAFTEVLFLKSAHVYVEFYTTKDKIVVRGTLAEFLQKLPEYFVQSHRSYVVNTNYVEEFNTRLLTISTHQIPISAAFKNRFFDAMK